jgi:hypothetical protein
MHQHEHLDNCPGKSFFGIIEWPLRITNLAQMLAAME